MKRIRACGLGLMIAVSLVELAAEAHVAEAQVAKIELAQLTDLGCRRVNARTGVYAQPNFSSATQRVLPQAQIVRLASAADGWAQVSQPLVGWVEARYLSPPIACEPRISSPARVPASGSAPVFSASPRNPTSTAVCRVTSPNGLTVRSQPSLEQGLFITSLEQGNHAFRFTGQTTRTQTSLGTLTWLYITAPVAGWITAGYVGQPPTITGDRCG